MRTLPLALLWCLIGLVLGHARVEADDAIAGRALPPWQRGMLDIHHHIIEPFAKALTGGEPAQLWKRFWMPLEAAATVQSVYAGSKWTFLEALRAHEGNKTRAAETLGVSYKTLLTKIKDYEL